jgi:hypothetical protein
MYNNSLGEFVKNALLHAGCDPALIHDLDSRATVRIELDDYPCMYVGTMSERPVIWSDLCEFSESIVQCCSEQLLREIMAGFPFSRSGQLVLRENQGCLQIYADVTDECLQDAKTMAEAINAFFESQSRLMEIVRQ